MIKSITTSREYAICKESGIKRDFASALNNLDELDREINEQVRKCRDRQALSQSNAFRILTK